MVYKYPTRTVKPPVYNQSKSVQRTGVEEVLTGLVQGQDASDLEERWSRSMDKLGIEYEFRVRLSPLVAGYRKIGVAAQNAPGEIEIDFLTYHNGNTLPIQIDGQIAHYQTPAQAEADKEKTAAIDVTMEQVGGKSTVRIPFTEILTREMSDRKAEMLFI
jgi:hypothetical protein